MTKVYDFSSYFIKPDYRNPLYIYFFLLFFLSLPGEFASMHAEEIYPITYTKRLTKFCLDCLFKQANKTYL